MGGVPRKDRTVIEFYSAIKRSLYSADSDKFANGGPHFLSHLLSFRYDIY